MNITPLSNPKGVKLTCELCGKPAYLQCPTCRVTYYCGKEHERLDRHSIHKKICHLLLPLRSSLSVLGTEEEREHRRKQTHQRQVQILELTTTEAHKKLYESQFELAIPAALQSLRFSMDIYGQDSIELVPSYLLLGEASIGLEQYNQAEDYLSLAKWAVIKAKTCENEIRAQLHRNFGLLYAAKKNYDLALNHVSNEIYFSSLLHGPNHIAVSGGYFQLGKIFGQINRVKQTGKVYDKIIEIWRTFLIDNEQERMLEKMNEAQQAEAIQMLSTIFDHRCQHTASEDKIAEIYYVISFLFASCSQIEKAIEYAKKATEMYEAMEGSKDDYVCKITRLSTLVTSLEN